MTISLKNLRLNSPVFLAPMAGITDFPSRAIVQSFKSGLVVSEMIASQDVYEKSFIIKVKKNVQNCQARDKACPTSIQIAGADPVLMAQAATVIEDQGGKVIDINMGCPAKKVIGQSSGAALMREPGKALKIIESVTNATSLPVTLKIRLGWENDVVSAPYLAKKAEEAGISMITVHARYRNQFFKGRPHWQKVKQVSETISIPVIINGDISDLESAQRAIKDSGAKGIMIGRASFGKPWLIAEIGAKILGESSPKIPHGKDLVLLIKNHYTSMLSHYGVEAGVKKGRKHLSAYFNNMGIEYNLIKKVLESDCYHTVLEIIDNQVYESYMRK